MADGNSRFTCNNSDINEMEAVLPAWGRASKNIIL